MSQGVEYISAQCHPFWIGIGYCCVTESNVPQQIICGEQKFDSMHPLYHRL